MNQDNVNYKGGGIWSYKNSKGFPETTNQVFPLLPPDGFLRQKMPGVYEIIVPRTGDRIINDLIQKKNRKCRNCWEPGWSVGSHGLQSTGTSAGS
jgi:hypothetical protein